jgi:hypothetical protein
MSSLIQNPDIFNGLDILCKKTVLTNNLALPMVVQHSAGPWEPVTSPMPTRPPKASLLPASLGVFLNLI